MVACGSGPQVTVCISSPENGGFLCADPEDKRSFVRYEDSGNYIAFTPEDARTLLTACSIGSDDIVASVEPTRNLKTIARRVPTFRAMVYEEKGRRDYYKYWQHY